MKTSKLNILALTGLAVSALALSTPTLARDRDDYVRHTSYEREYDRGYRADYDRRHFVPRHHVEHRQVVIERPVYVQQRPVVIERAVYVEQAPVYNQAPQGSIGAIVGGAIGAILGDRVTDGR